MEHGTRRGPVDHRVFRLRRIIPCYGGPQAAVIIAHVLIDQDGVAVGIGEHEVRRAIDGSFDDRARGRDGPRRR
jgi:hypothetical protein